MIIQTFEMVNLITIDMIEMIFDDEDEGRRSKYYHGYLCILSSRISSRIKKQYTRSVCAVHSRQSISFLSTTIYISVQKRLIDFRYSRTH